MTSKLDIFDWNNLKAAELSTALKVLASAMQERFNIGASTYIDDTYFEFFDYAGNSPEISTSLGAPITSIFLWRLEELLYELVRFVGIPDPLKLYDGAPPLPGISGYDVTPQDFLDQLGVTRWQWFSRNMAVFTTTPNERITIITPEYIKQMYDAITYIKYVNGPNSFGVHPQPERNFVTKNNAIGVANSSQSYDFNYDDHYSSLYQDPILQGSNPIVINGSADFTIIKPPFVGDRGIAMYASLGDLVVDLDKRRTQAKISENSSPLDVKIWEYYSAGSVDEVGVIHKPLASLFTDSVFSMPLDKSEYTVSGHLVQSNRPAVIPLNQSSSISRFLSSGTSNTPIEFWDGDGGFEYFTP